MPKSWVREYSFSGGLNSRDASHLINDDEVQDAWNFVFDPSGVVETRDGMELEQTLTVAGLSHTVVHDAESVTPPGATPPAGSWAVSTSNADDLRTAATRMSLDSTDEQEGTYCLDVITDMRNAIVSDLESTGGIESGWTDGDGTGAHDTTNMYQGSACWQSYTSTWASAGTGLYSATMNASKTFDTNKNWDGLNNTDDFHIMLGGLNYVTPPVTSTELVTNGGFETFTGSAGSNTEVWTGWTASRGTSGWIIASDTLPYAGTYQVHTDTSPPAVATNTLTSDYIPVSSGAGYSFSGRYKLTNGSAAASTKMELKCYDSSSVLVGTLTPLSTSTTQAAWTPVSYVVSSSSWPTGTTKIKIVLTFVCGGWSADEAHWDAISFQQTAYSSAETATITLTDSAAVTAIATTDLHVTGSTPDWTEYSIAKGDFSAGAGFLWSDVDSMKVEVVATVSSTSAPTSTVYTWWDICWWSPYHETVTSTLTFTTAQNYATVAYTNKQPLRAYLHAGEWDTGLTHAGMTLSSADFQIKMAETPYTNNHYTPRYNYTVTGGWTTTWIPYADWSEAASASTTWATTIKSVRLRTNITVTISDASLLDGTSTAEYVVLTKFDEFKWYGTSANTVVRGIYKFFKSNGNIYYYTAIAGKLRGGQSSDASTWDHDDLTRTTPDYTATAWWQFCTLNDICVATNGVDAPQKLVDGSTDAVALAAAAPVTAYCTVHENRVFLGGGATYPNTVFFSGLADPTSWDTTLGTFDCYTADNQKITGMVPWKGNLIIFKQEAIFVLVAKGMPEYWELYRVDNHGCLAPRSIVATDVGVLFLSSDGVRVYTDGPSSLVSSKIWPTLRDNILWTKTDEICAEEYDNLYRLWFVPTGGTYATHCAVLDTTTATWSFWKTSGTAVTCLYRDKLESNTLFAGSSNAEVIHCDTGDDDMGSSIACTLTTKDLNMAVPERDKKYKRVYVIAGATDPQQYLTVDYNVDFATAGTGLTSDHPNDVDLYHASDKIVEKRESIGGRGKYINLVFSLARGPDAVRIYGYTWGYRPKKLR